MRVIFNSKVLDAPATMNYQDAFRFNKDIDFFNWNDYHKYDVALFMSYDEDLESIKKVKDFSLDIKIGLIDPRGEIKEEIINQIDFFIIDSIEMSDYISKFSKPYFIFYEYPYFKHTMKQHIDKQCITIAYHGNKVHLESMYPRVSEALDKLAKKYKIKLTAIYNIKELGRWKKGLPLNTEIEHVQWHENVYLENLFKADIGILPTLDHLISDDPVHYNLNFKMPSNAGRLIVFSRLGIPVVAEFLPSHFQFIDHGQDGFLVYNSSSWYNSLEKLINDTNLRNFFAKKMQSKIYDKTNYNSQNYNLNQFLMKIINR
tara:strand:+ start:1564 stop:2511 length:948 start_codon:yes stop_codon:yes gene_type:complete